MILLLGIITLFCGIFVYRIRKDVLHPLFFFDLLWASILILFCLPILDFIEISNTVVSVLYVMILTPNVVTLIYRICCGARYLTFNRKGTSTANCNYVLRESLFLFMLVLSIITMLVDEFAIIQSLLSGKSFSQIMAAAGGKGTVEISGTVQVCLYMFLVHPMQYLSSPVCAVEYLSTKKKRFLILNIIYLILAVVHHGGRNAIFLFILSYLAGIVMISKGGHLIAKIKQNWKYIIVFFLLANLIISISSSRGIEDVWLSFYIYFVCCLPLSSRYLTLYLGNYVGQSLGMYSLCGYFYPLFSVLEFLGIKAPKAYDVAKEIEHIVEGHYLSISSYSKIGTNSFMIAGMYPYMDGGFIGELIMIAVISILIYTAYLKYKKQPNNKNKTIYILLLTGIFLSFARFALTSYGYALALLYSVFFIYRKPQLTT